MQKHKQYGVSLLSEIKMAKTREAVEALLVKGTTYKTVEAGTALKWDRAARKRLAAIDTAYNKSTCPAVKEAKDAQTNPA